MHAGRNIAERKGGRVVGSAIFPAERRHPRISLPDEVVAGVRRKRSRLAESRDRAHDYPGIELAGAFIVKAHASDDAWRVVLHNHIDLRYEVAYDGPSGRSLDVQAQAHFTAVLLDEVGTPLVTYIWEITTQITGGCEFDLDNFSAHFGHQLGDRGARDILREVENLVSVEQWLASAVSQVVLSRCRDFS